MQGSFLETPRKPAETAVFFFFKEQKCPSCHRLPGEARGVGGGDTEELPDHSAAPELAWLGQVSVAFSF